MTRLALVSGSRCLLVFLAFHFDYHTILVRRAGGTINRIPLEQIGILSAWFQFKRKGGSLGCMAGASLLYLCADLLSWRPSLFREKTKHHLTISIELARCFRNVKVPKGT
jgi:hypothetical protein